MIDWKFGTRQRERAKLGVSDDMKSFDIPKRMHMLGTNVERDSGEGKWLTELPLNWL